MIPELPEDHAEKYHAVFASYFEHYGFERELEVRDLGHNNVGMYLCYSQYINIGPFWKHLDKVSDEDLRHYWSMPREWAEMLARASND